FGMPQLFESAAAAATAEKAKRLARGLPEPPRREGGVDFALYLPASVALRLAESRADPERLYGLRLDQPIPDDFKPEDQATVNKINTVIERMRGLFREAGGGKPEKLFDFISQLKSSRIYQTLEPRERLYLSQEIRKRLSGEGVFFEALEEAAASLRQPALDQNERSAVDTFIEGWRSARLGQEEVTFKTILEKARNLSPEARVCLYDRLVRRGLKEDKARLLLTAKKLLLTSHAGAKARIFMIRKRAGRVAIEAKQPSRGLVGEAALERKRRAVPEEFTAGDRKYRVDVSTFEEGRLNENVETGDLVIVTDDGGRTDALTGLTDDDLRGLYESSSGDLLKKLEELGYKGSVLRVK
ncbi:MAG: hypothetical protein AB1715_14055, partial [Acidobacteriota bacterium]